MFLDDTNYFEKVTNGYYQLRLGITHNDITNFLIKNNISLPDEIIENIKTLFESKERTSDDQHIIEVEQKTEIRDAVKKLRAIKKEQIKINEQYDAAKKY